MTTRFGGELDRSRTAFLYPVTEIRFVRAVVESIIMVAIPAATVTAPVGVDASAIPAAMEDNPCPAAVSFRRGSHAAHRPMNTISEGETP